jgi:uncharacterized protein (DUF924 family)
VNSALANQILDFWFLPATHTDHNRSRREWFRKDENFDALIREKFGDAIEVALTASEFDADNSDQMLAKILLLDQFTRNIFRGTARAFAGDARALRLAITMSNSGVDQTLPPTRRMFAYLPFEHAEDLAMQERSVAMFAALQASASADFANQLDYARRHHAIIARFGRFPHRNEILGRTSTLDETEFLTQPGSSF